MTMLEVYERLGEAPEDTGALSVVLTHEQRERGRLRVYTHDGIELRIFVERGQPLRVGETLRSVCGQHIRIQGAPEPVVRAFCNDWELFSRACYHLGNRHVKVQLGHTHENGRCRPWLRLLPDHVLEAMLEQLGLTLLNEEAVFVPEGGAWGYGQQHNHHHHH